MRSYTNFIEVLIYGDAILFGASYKSDLINTGNISPASPNRNAERRQYKNIRLRLKFFISL